MVITLDARQDFLYRAPRKIMSFVLANLLHSTLRLIPSGVPREVSVELAPGGDSNEVRITSEWLQSRATI